jgi:nicotinamidase-related amidase
LNLQTDRYTAPEFEAVALITIDVQCDFLDDGRAAIPGTRAVLPQIAELLAIFRKTARPIVHVVRIYRADGSNADRCRRSLIEAGRDIVRPGTSGVELAPALWLDTGSQLDPDRLLAGHLQQLGPREWAIYKPRWGAFYQTALEAHLRSLSISTVAIVGCNFPNCPRTSVYEASERDFRVVMVSDAVSGLYDRGADELENIGVTVMPTSALLAVTASARSAQAETART